MQCGACAGAQSVKPTWAGSQRSLPPLGHGQRLNRVLASRAPHCAPGRTCHTPGRSGSCIASPLLGTLPPGGFGDGWDGNAWNSSWHSTWNVVGIACVGFSLFSIIFLLLWESPSLSTPLPPPRHALRLSPGPNLARSCRSAKVSTALHSQLLWGCVLGRGCAGVLGVRRFPPEAPAPVLGVPFLARRH